LFLLISIYSFFTIIYSYFLFAGHFVEGCQKEALMEILIAPEQMTPEQVPPEQALQLTTDEAMNQDFGTSSEEYEDEAEEVGEEEVDRGHQDGAQQDGGQQHNYIFLFLVNFYSQLD
jgi:flagellar biosynthesis/type III secretory pathway protein FliH